MVGALADWFAVTALFRHPLGHPHPPHGDHPAPQGPDRRVARRVRAGELPHPGGAARAARPGARRASGSAAGSASRRTPSRPASAWPMRARRPRGASTTATSAARSRALVERKIRETPVAPLMGRAIDVGDGGRPPPTPARRHAHRPRQLPRRQPHHLPRTACHRVAVVGAGGASTTASSTRSTPRCTASSPTSATTVPRRPPLHRRAHRSPSPTGLRTDPGLIAKGEAVKAELLAHRDVQAWLRSLWGEVKRTTLIATDDPDSELRHRIDLARAPRAPAGR